MLVVEQLGKSYGWGARRRWALAEVGFSLQAGDFALLTGPSGAGKSTLIRLVLGEQRPCQGRIRVGGRDVHRLTRASLPFLRRNVGVVFQDFKLLEAATVFENVSLPLAVLGEPTRAIRSRTHEALERVRLAELAGAPVAALSGGERQRVALARALIIEPAVLLADEPTGNLDPGLTQEVLGLFAQASRKGATILLATHDPLVVESAPAQRWLALDRGRLVRDDDLRPANAEELMILEAVA